MTALDLQGQALAQSLPRAADASAAATIDEHYHVVIYDRMGGYPEFLEHFHKLVARSQNALRGRWENFWSSEQTCVVKRVGRDAVIDKLVYAAANPVLDHLVDRVHHWPGVNGLTALLTGRTFRATRPLHFFRREGAMPQTLEAPLTVPPELGPAAEVLSELRDRVRAVEEDHAAERLRTGRRVLGRRGGLAQSWRKHPSSWEPSTEPAAAGRIAKQVGAARGGAAKSRICHGVRRCRRTLAARCSGRVPARYLLAPAVRLGAGARDMI